MGFLSFHAERYRKEGEGVMYFWGLVISNYLRLHGRNRRLQVVGLQVALEVEDLELILLRQRQQLAQGRTALLVRLDELLLHQVVGLGVGADLGRNLGAGEQRALRNAEERAERIRDGRRLREDRLLLDDRLTTLRYGGSAAAATLGRLLELTGNLLLELLHVRQDSAEHRAEGVDLLHEGVEVLDDVDLLGGGSGDGRGGNGGRRRGGDYDLDGRRRRGGDNGRSGGGCSLLGGGTLGRGGGRAHCCYMCDRGVFLLNQTRGEYLLQLRIFISINFVHRKGEKF